MLIDNAKLPKPVREIAMMVTGAKLQSRYELYPREKSRCSAGP